MTVRNRMLVLFGLLAAGICVLLGSVGVLISRDTLDVEVQASTAQIVTGRAAELGRWIDGLKRMIGEFARHPAFVAQDKKLVKEYLNGRKGDLQQDVEMLFYGFPDGSAPTTASIEANIADRDYFKKIMSGKESLVISDAIVSRSTGQPIIVIAVPSREKTGSVQGVVAATITLGAISDIAGKVRIGKEGYGWIMDGKGIVLAHPEEKIRMKLNAKEADKQGFIGLSSAALRMDEL